jgi:hypothetical protein
VPNRLDGFFSKKTRVVKEYWRRYDAPADSLTDAFIAANGGEEPFESVEAFSSTQLGMGAQHVVADEEAAAAVAATVAAAAAAATADVSN